MANISKIEYFGKVLIDLSEDTVTAETLIKGVTAHDKTGTQITGTAETGSDTSDATATAGDIAYEKTAYVNGEKITGTLREVKSGGTATGYSGATPSVSGTELKFSKEATVDRIWRTGGTMFLNAPLTEFGDAAAEDVAAGKTFTSAAGLKVAGTAQTSAASPVIESLEITENGTYTAPDGTDGYNPITVNVPASGGGGLPDTIVAGDTPILGSWSGAYVSTTTVTDTGLAVTVPKAGMYRFYIPAYAASTYSIGGSSSPPVYLYRNGEQAAETTAGNSPTAPLMLELECAAGDVISVWAAGVSSTYTTTGVRVLALVACIEA